MRSLPVAFSRCSAVFCHLLPHGVLRKWGVGVEVGGIIANMFKLCEVILQAEVELVQQIAGT